MQIGEQHLAFAHPAVLRLDGLLDLQQEIGLLPHLVGGLDDLGAGGDEVGVVQRRTFAGTCLNEYLVAVAYQFAGARRGDGDPVLVVLDLSRDADAHACSSVVDR